MSNIVGSTNPTPRMEGYIFPRGEDGISPVVEVSKVTGGHDVKVTDVHGAKNFHVADGYTPVKGKDYFDGKDGKDGVPAEHSWNGTVLTVTSKSGTSSADLKGDKGDKGDTYTLTAEDKDEIVERVSAPVAADAAAAQEAKLSAATAARNASSFASSAQASAKEADNQRQATLELRNQTETHYANANIAANNAQSASSESANSAYRAMMSEQNAAKSAQDALNNATSKNSDWNAGEGETGYVRNRTHYLEVEQKGFDFSADIAFKNMMASVTGIGTASILEGKEYTVTWNGKAYTCTAVLNGSVMLGNLSLLDMGANTSEPFCFEMLTENTASVVKATATTETISVKIKLPQVEIIHKLPKMFLPDSVGTVKSVNGFFPDDNGNVTMPGGSGGGEQSDWNAFKGQPGHVLNRTHWVGPKEIFPETKFESEASTTTFIANVVLDIVGGKNYIVVYNGTNYVLTAEDIGKSQIVLGKAGTHGFSITYVGNSEFAQFVLLKAALSATFAIYDPSAETVHKLDPKFLPDDIGGGMGGADWNAPEGAPGHVLNRTHWVEQGDKEYILEETTLQIYGGMAVHDTNCQPLTVGETYIVNWNGVEYAYVAQDVSELAGQPGAVSLGGSNANSGEPFGLMIAPLSNAAQYNLTVVIQPFDGTTDLTISIYKAIEIVHKLPGKFLPDGVPYTDVGVTDLLPESEASSFTHPAFGTMWMVRKAVKLNVGETYTITYNGTPYKCVCQAAPAGLIEDPNAVAMGNFSVVGGANTGEPFAMLISYTYKEVDIIDLVGSSSVVVKIVGIGEIVHQMDEKLLPESVDGIIIRSSTPGSTKKFKLTVDDSGAPTIVEVT